MRLSLCELVELHRGGEPLLPHQVGDLMAAALRDASDEQLFGELARRGKWVLEVSEELPADPDADVERAP